MALGKRKRYLLSANHIAGSDNIVADYHIAGNANIVADNHIAGNDNIVAANHIAGSDNIVADDHIAGNDNIVADNHIAGNDNIIADYKSRNFKENTEWKFRVTTTFFCPDCDLFASRLNTQVSKFASWFPESGSWVVNAFSISWWDVKFYAFPPFSLVGRILAKVQQEVAVGIMIVPLWNTQAWFPLMLRILVDHPRLIPPHQDLLQLPGQVNLVHPLHKKLALLAIHISARQLDNTIYQQQLSISSATPGGEVPDHNMTLPSGGGENFVLEGKLIPLVLL